MIKSFLRWAAVNAILAMANELCAIHSYVNGEYNRAIWEGCMALLGWCAAGFFYNRAWACKHI
jgi:hypothetical protein